MIDRELAEQFRCLRARRGLTQQELAQKIGVHQQVVARLECGLVGYNFVFRAAKALKAEVDIRLVPSEALQHR
jgi:transcriptional regulator with XRE-family HTH domain